jgi:hypothetical protein
MRKNLALIVKSQSIRLTTIAKSMVVLMMIARGK